jgi:hypothetical protein
MRTANGASAPCQARHIDENAHAVEVLGRIVGDSEATESQVNTVDYGIESG